MSILHHLLFSNYEQKHHICIQLTSIEIWQSLKILCYYFSEGAK